MDTQVLAAKLNSLESSWSSLDWWLNLWTLLVVIGVGVELVVIATEYRHARADFKRGTIHSPDKPSILLFVVGFLGGGLVAIGVAGEFRVHIEAGRIETELRDTTRQLVSLTDQKAARAQLDASEASERASSSDEQSTSKKKDVARLNREAEVAKLESLRLRQQIQPREFNASEQKRIIDACASFNGDLVNIRSQPFDVEGAVFAYSLLDVLNRTYLRLSSSGIGNNFMLNLAMTFDVHITGPAGEQSLVKALAESLATPRVLVAPLEPPTPNGSVLTILVGAKR